MAVEKAALDLFSINPIAASRLALERTLEEFQQVCDHISCRTIKRKLKKNIGKFTVSFDDFSSHAEALSVPPMVCEKKAKARK